jgi:hypothetical protein
LLSVELIEINKIPKLAKIDDAFANCDIYPELAYESAVKDLVEPERVT